MTPSSAGSPSSTAQEAGSSNLPEKLPGSSGSDEYREEIVAGEVPLQDFIAKILNGYKVPKEERQWPAELLVDDGHRLDELALVGGRLALCGLPEWTSYPKLKRITGETWGGKPVGELAAHIFVDLTQSAGRFLKGRYKKPMFDGATVSLHSDSIETGQPTSRVGREAFDFEREFEALRRSADLEEAADSEEGLATTLTSLQYSDPEAHARARDLLDAEEAGPLSASIERIRRIAAEALED